MNMDTDAHGIFGMIFWGVGWGGGQRGGGRYFLLCEPFLSTNAARRRVIML